MVAVWQAALVSDESALEACLRRCTIQIDEFYLLPSACRIDAVGWFTDQVAFRLLY